MHMCRHDTSILFCSLARRSIYLNCCHFSSLRSAAIQPPPSSETLQNHNVMHVGQNLLNAAGLTAHTHRRRSVTHTRRGRQRGQSLLCYHRRPKQAEAAPRFCLLEGEMQSRSVADSFLQKLEQKLKIRVRTLEVNSHMEFTNKQTNKKQG